MSVYSCEMKVRLPADKDWGRETTYSDKLPVTADNPTDLVERVVMAIIAKAGFPGDPNYLCGTILNLANRMPMQWRAAIAAGIIQGTVMEITAEDGEIVAEMKQGVDSLPNQQGATQRPSGIIVPGEGQA